MKVLIAKANLDIIKSALEVCIDYAHKLKVTESTKNTCIVHLKKEVDFTELYDEVKRRGYNPFALMSW